MQNKGTKPKDPTKERTSKKTRSPTKNTRKVAERGQASGSSVASKNPRKKEIVSRI